MTAERDRLVERRDLVSRDLEELDAQVEAGEIDDATAERLRGAYRADLEVLNASIRDMPELDARLDARLGGSCPRAPRRGAPGSIAPSGRRGITHHHRAPLGRDRVRRP